MNTQHTIFSGSNINPQSATTISSPSGLTRWSRSNQLANLPHLDIRVKPEYDSIENTGRSMVEMLGVLAIIGVLSVGAIAGYSKAMMKYKLNKQSEQLNTIINASIRYYNDLKLKNPDSNQYDLAPILEKLGEIPQEMKHYQGSNLYLRDIFGHTISVYYHRTNYLGIIEYIDKSSHSMEACRNTIITAKENHADIDSVFFRNDYSDNQEWSNDIYGDRECFNSRTCLKDMTMQQIDDACKFCASDQCLLYITIR